MTNQELTEIIKNFELKIEILEQQYLTINISYNQLHKLAQKLKEDEQIKMDYLILITGIDYRETFGCTYLLTSSSKNHTVEIKVSDIQKEEAQIDSVSDLWPTANFHEREIYDLMGIKFNNHPDLRRIFLDEENWQGYPLRKDYQDDVNIVSRKI